MPSSTFYSVFLIHCLCCLRIFPTKVQSPIICGFSPVAYTQPWLGLHSLNLPHTPSFDSSRKAEDILKDAIIHSTQGGPVSKARLIPCCLNLHSTRPGLEKCRDNSIARSSSLLSACSMLSLQAQTCQIPLSTAITIRHLLLK